jgi:branched-chain amino acid transport system substrate-binding protein
VRFDRAVMSAVGTVLLVALLDATAARAQVSDDVVKIGVLNDQSGLYADLGGPGTVVAARMAVEDAGGSVLGKPVEVVFADHQNKSDVGAAIARQWFEVGKVDMAIGFDNSAVALAVEQLAAERNRIAIAGAVGSTAFTGKSCTTTEASWIYDSYALTTSLAKAIVAQGQDSWFFITVDYTFGHSLEADATSAVQAAGGKVLGSVRHPLNTADFSSYLLQAQASGAKVVAFANGGGDMVNAVKQANEFGLTKNQTMATLLVFLSDVHSMQLQAAQGLKFVTGFYWDRNDETRAWSKHFFERQGTMPTQVQASAYSAIRHYLAAITAAGTDEAKAVMAKMREMPVNDFYVKNGRLREDGRLVHDMYFAQVKAPAESSGPWDYYKILGTIPGDKAFRPLAEGGCPLVTRH